MLFSGRYWRMEHRFVPFSGRSRRLDSDDFLLLEDPPALATLRFRLSCCRDVVASWRVLETTSPNALPALDEYLFQVTLLLSGSSFTAEQVAFYEEQHAFLKKQVLR